jgi:hypothetical protein
MTMNNIQPQPELNALAERDVSPTSNHRLARIRQATEKGGRLIADLSDFLTRRKHGRGGLYLPLVRVERGE